MDQTIIQGQQTILFQVTDTGIGMTKDEKQRLKALLETETAQTESVSKNTAGFGLGLFISNKIAEILGNQKRRDGGGIHWKSKVSHPLLSSQPNEGSVFWFSVKNFSFDEVPKTNPENSKTSQLYRIEKKVVVDLKESSINSFSNQKSIHHPRFLKSKNS